MFLCRPDGVNGTPQMLWTEMKILQRISANAAQLQAPGHHGGDLILGNLIGSRRSYLLDGVTVRFSSIIFLSTHACFNG